MDLVDIDKVLDNLELNEEEHKDDIPVIKYLQILSSDNNISPADVITSNAATSANIASYNTNNCSSATTTNATGDRVNRFVGVSQVFSSLDDYRKNVESLEAGMQLYNPNVTKDNDMHVDNSKIQDEDEVVAPGHANVMERNDEESDDAYAEDKINKFACTDEEHGFSSNSITTSSSSTFSSGPSPGLLSTESESSFDVKLWDKSLMLDKKCDDMSTRQLGGHYDHANKSYCGGIEPQRSEFDELAVGLSSISLTHQDSLLQSKITSSKTATTNYLNSEEELRQEPQEHVEVSDLKNFQNIEQANNSQQDVMVTFGSTMDEISDTELDSILQEIDAGMPLQQASTEIDRGKSTSACETIKTKIDREVNISNEDNIASAGLAPISCDIVCDDAINIDSFSQASTIEFSEDQIHEDDIDNNYKSMEEICDGDSDIKKRVAGQKRQRPTTLDLPVRKVNLYATAGQTPPGSRIYDQATSSSDEDTPEGEQGALAQSDVQINFNDAAGHTPPERQDRTIVSDESFAPIEVTGARDTASNFDDPMAMPDIADVENQISTLSLRSEVHPNVGKIKPTWVPDHEANACMQCQHKFTLLKRRHHCRACGHVLCSVCCSQKFNLEFLSNTESRVCVQCFLVLTKRQQYIEEQTATETATANVSSVLRTPNPNNPMEYCSTIPPHRQVNTQTMSNPTVIVPVGVLKKEGNLKKSRKRKSVMFSDGIRPGSDLASLDGKWSDAKHARKSVPSTHFTTDNAGSTPNVANIKPIAKKGSNKKTMAFLDAQGSFIQKDGNSLPLICITNKSEQVYQEVPNNADLIKRLHTETLKFAVQTNFYVIVKISHLKCCINKTVINFTTCGLHHVGNDEIIILLELDNSNQIPKDIFVHLNEIYVEASKGHPITEFGFSMPKDLQFLGSREHGGFLFIRSTFQCLQDVHVPSAPFLIGVLIHRWEVPWAKIFPLRLMLRLGAQYRYYPSPHISVREREPVYAEIAQTIINLLADFRNYTYTLPTIKGMYIHMEDRRTNILIPRNRHDEIIKAINNSSDHILAMGANFSKKADGHLVCIQNMKSESTDSHSYSTQAINIQGQPRKVTGASFFVLNEALKTTSGLSGKCSIIEDGLMVQILPSKMVDIRNALINMKDIDIVCGPIEAGEKQTEVVYIQWVDADVEINIGVKSPIDSKEMDGIPSIRVHSGNNLSNSNHIIQWTEVFVIEMSDESSFKQSTQTAVVSKISEQIAKNASVALLPFLDLLAANGNVKIGLRVTLNQDNVCYEAGSQNEKLPPLYMNALDNELIQTLHKQANEIGKTMVLELIFHILNV